MSRLFGGGQSSTPAYQPPMPAPSTENKESLDEKRRLKNIDRLKSMDYQNNPLAEKQETKKTLLGGK